MVGGVFVEWKKIFPDKKIAATKKNVSKSSLSVDEPTAPNDGSISSAGPARRSGFAPVDPVTGSLFKNQATGELADESVVADSRQFKGFMEWFTRASNGPLLDKAYRALALSMAQDAADKDHRAAVAAAKRAKLPPPSAPAPVAQPEVDLVVKGAFVHAVCGPHVRRLLNQANANAKAGLGREADPRAVDAMRDMVAEAKSELQEFAHVLKKKLFVAQVQGSFGSRAGNYLLLSEGETRRLLESFEVESSHVMELGSFMAKTVKKLGAAAKSELPRELRKRMEQPQARAQIIRGADEEFDFESYGKLGQFAPFIQFLEQEVDPSIRMEMACQFEDYVRSGWFARDHVDKATDAACSEGSWHMATHETAERLRDVFQRLADTPKGRPGPARHEVARAFRDRVAELALWVTCKGARERAPGDDDEAMRPQGEYYVEKVERIDKDQLFKRFEAQHRPDSFWISPDGGTFYISCATSRDTLEKEGNQLVRYLRAVEASLAAGKLGQLPIPAGLDPKVDARTLAVSYAQSGQSRRGGNKPGHLLLECFDLPPGVPGAEERLVQALNSLPALSLVTSDVKDLLVGELNKHKCDLVGAKEELWSRALVHAREKIGAGADAKATEMLALCDCLASVAKGFEGVAPNDKLVYSPNPHAAGDKAFQGLKSLRQFMSFVLREQRAFQAGEERGSAESSVASGMALGLLSDVPKALEPVIEAMKLTAGTYDEQSLVCMVVDELGLLRDRLTVAEAKALAAVKAKAVSGGQGGAKGAGKAAPSGGAAGGAMSAFAEKAGAEAKKLSRGGAQVLSAAQAKRGAPKKSKKGGAPGA